MAFRHYTQLRVWQRASDLAFDAYKLSDKFPRREWYGITAHFGGPPWRSSSISLKDTAERLRANS